MTRHIPFDAIENFRDFGDYAAGQKWLKRGLLYRSASQSRASDEDLARMAALGLSVIVDLRRANEREREPSRRWEGFGAEFIENDIGQEHSDEWHVFLAGSDLSPGSFRNYMLDYYRHLPLQHRHIDLYSRYFKALAQTTGPVLVHCAAGKDRTGILCALTHHVAGVQDDDIIADYLLTNNTERQMARLPMMREAVQDATGRVASDEALMTAMRVEPEYLDMAFSVMRQAQGSLDGYLEQVLGLNADLRARLHDRKLS